MFLFSSVKNETFCELDSVTAVKDAVMKLHRCVAEITVRVEVKSGVV